MIFVYMIKNSAGKLYIGITNSPQRRLLEHNTRHGACFTKYVPNYEIVFLERYSNIIEARKREIQIKKWRRDKKEVLIYRYKHGLETKPGMF